VYKQKFQSGFAHLMIITVIFGLGLVGTLGLVFYQNFMKPKVNDIKTDSSKTDNSVKPVVKKETNKTYSDSRYDFSYPSSGWSVGTQSLDDRLANLSATDLLVVYSDDYKVGDVGTDISPISITNGAKIEISSSGTGSEINAEIEKNLQSNGMRGELTTITVAGVTAYSYKWTYEGTPFYGTEFVKNNKGYYIIFRPALDQQDSYKSAYEQIRQTLVIK